MARKGVPAVEPEMSVRLDSVRPQLLPPLVDPRHVVRRADAVYELSAVRISVKGRPVPDRNSRDNQRRVPAGAAQLDGRGGLSHRPGRVPPVRARRGLHLDRPQLLRCKCFHLSVPIVFWPSDQSFWPSDQYLFNMVVSCFNLSCSVRRQLVNGAGRTGGRWSTATGAEKYASGHHLNTLAFHTLSLSH